MHSKGGVRFARSLVCIHASRIIPSLAHAAGVARVGYRAHVRHRARVARWCAIISYSTMDEEHYKLEVLYGGTPLPDVDVWSEVFRWTDAENVFEEGNLDKLTQPNRNAFFKIGNVRKRLRMKVAQGLTPFDTKAIQTTLNNIGASDGLCGHGALFQRLPIGEDVETSLLKMLPFECIAKYIVLKHLLTIEQSMSVEEWQAFCKEGPHRPHRSVEVSKDEQVKWYRFDNGTMSLKTRKSVADAFHTNAKEWGCLKVGDARSKEGLERYSFPGARSVSAARRKIFFLLRSEADRVAFCKQQMYGRRDVDLLDTLHIFKSKSPDDVHISVNLANTLARKLEEIEGSPTGSPTGSPEPTLNNERPLKRHRQTTSRSREGSRQNSKTEAYLKDRAEKAEQESREKDSELDRLRHELEKLKLEQEAAHEEANNDIGIKIEEDSDDDSVDSEERERFFREHDERLEQYERARDEKEIQEHGMEIHQKMKRRRLSQHDATHVLTFLEFRNAYRTMREKRVIQIEFIVWLPVFMFAAYFAACEYGAAYIHEQGYLYALDDPRLRGNDGIAIYAFIFLCSLIMVTFFAGSVPTACDWFYGLLIMPATRLCFPSNQGYASMIAVILLCSQNRKSLLFMELLCVICFIIFAPLANRFIFIARVTLSLVFYQNRLINHIDHRTPTIFLSVWRELILTVLFAAHWVIDHLQMFLCGCAGHE